MECKRRKEMEKVEVEVNIESLKELVDGNKVFRSAYDFRLSDEDIEKSRQELRETDEDRKVSLRKFKNALSDDPDFNYRMDDAYLLRFLRFRKFKVEEAHRCLRNLYLGRQEHPDLFSIPSNLDSLFNSDIMNMAPYRNEDGSMIFIMRLGCWDTDEMSFRDLLHMGTCIGDLVTLNPHCQINGCTGIWDFAQPTFKQASQALRNCQPSLWLKILQDMYPWRVKRLIFFRCNTLLHSTLSALRWMLKPKISERIVLLRSDLNELHQYVNPALLPKEYGGELEDEECYSYLKNIILGNLRYLQYEHSFGGKNNQ